MQLVGDILENWNTYAGKSFPGTTKGLPIDVSDAKDDDRSAKGKEKDNKTMINPQPPKSYAPELLPELSEGSDSDSPLAKVLSTKLRTSTKLITQPSVKARPTPPQPLSSHFVMPSCVSCGLRGNAAERVIGCNLCGVVWHVLCMQEYLPGDLIKRTEFKFCCPECRYTVNGRWDRLMCVFSCLITVMES